MEDNVCAIEQQATKLLKSGNGRFQMYLVRQGGAISIAHHGDVSSDILLMVYPHELLNGIKEHASVGMYTLAADGIMHRPNKTTVRWFPFIWCEQLFHAIVTVLHQKHEYLLALQKDRGQIEIAGDILCSWTTRGGWVVELDVCDDWKAEMYSSTPSCGRKRKCNNARRMDLVAVGEFHTHPPGETPYTCKPPSHYDLYQLLLAAGNGFHNFLATVCREGLYIVSGSRQAVRSMLTELHEYYRLHGKKMDERKIREHGQCTFQSQQCTLTKTLHAECRFRTKYHAPSLFCTCCSQRKREDWRRSISNC